MSRTLRIAGIACVLSGLLARFTPQYSIGLITTAIFSFFCLFTADILYWIFLYPSFFSPLRHIPEAPDRHWLLGQTPRVLKDPSGYPQRDWILEVPNDGLIRYNNWFRERLLLTTPAALGEVLVTKAYDFIKPTQIRRGLGRVLGVGVLLAEGEEHKIQRKNLLPAFSFRHVKDIYPIFWSKAQEMVKCVAAASESNESTSEKHRREIDPSKAEVQHEPGAVDVGSWTSRATLDIIGLSGMGEDFNSLQDPNNKLNQTYRSIFNASRSGLILQLLGVLIPFWLLTRLPLKRNQQINNAAEVVKQVCRDSIKKKRAAMASEKGRSSVDILSVALESGGFQDEELVHQMMTFLLAGHETTATAMMWALLELSKHPDIQTKLRAEVRAKIPSLDSEITTPQIDDCHYLQAVCNEVLRFWAPVSLTLRVAGVDTSVRGQFVPAGTNIVMSPRAINTLPELWGADALEFKPERWLNAGDGKANSRGGSDSNFAMLTFLHGPRSCIGQKFAQAEFACLLAAWVGRFDTRLERGSPLAKEEVEIRTGVTQKPRGGLWCMVEEVPGW